MPAGEIAVSCVVALGVDRAFDEFTASVDRWWRRPPGGDASTVVRFEEGRLVSVSGSGAAVLADVVAWEPPARLRLAWHGPHAEAGDEVVVEFRAEGSGTRVVITHVRAGLAPEAARAAILGLMWADVASRFAAAC